MSKETKLRLINRLKSLAWRLSVMIVIVSLDFLMANLGDFNVPDQYTVIIGMIAGEITKYLNTHKSDSF